VKLLTHLFHVLLHFYYRLLLVKDTLGLASEMLRALIVFWIFMGPMVKLRYIYIHSCCTLVQGVCIHCSLWSMFKHSVCARMHVAALRSYTAVTL
jgi:hypothetical protein